MPERIVPVGDLPENKRAELKKSANWKIDGKRGDWAEATDPHYGNILHVAVVGEDGQIEFDKLNIQWVGGVYVTVVRVNPEGKAEFLIPREKRILLRNKQGQQGNVFVYNIPQGVIKEWEDETAVGAAIREVREETGYNLNSLALIGRIALSPANSETIQPFFLACLPYSQEPTTQQLEESETIEPQRWFTWFEIQKRPAVDGITIIGLSLAEKVLKRELL